MPGQLANAPNENDAAWLMKRCWKRMNRKNEHFVSTFVGQEGAGKSHTALKVGDLLDADFRHENVIFDVLDFLEILKDETYTPGDVYVIDEAGVSMGNRTWAEKQQVYANQALQLIRSHNVGLIFTLPLFGELDKQAAGRVQLLLHIKSKVDGEYVKIEPRLIDPDRVNRNGEVYKPYPQRANRTVNGAKQHVDITEIELTPPRESLIEPYEERKAEFQKQFYEDVIAEGRDDQEDVLEDPKEIAEDIIDSGHEEYIQEYNNGATVVFDKDLIKAEYDIGSRKAKQIKSMVVRELDLDVM